MIPPNVDSPCLPSNQFAEKVLLNLLASSTVVTTSYYQLDLELKIVHIRCFNRQRVNYDMDVQPRPIVFIWQKSAYQTPSPTHIFPSLGFFSRWLGKVIVVTG